MSRTERLFDLIQQLRQHRYPVQGVELANALGISLRTLYRDIASLRAQGADIEGEPGVGYLLQPGFMLPPLMFREEELEALALGSRWVASRADVQLRMAATQALAKIASVLPIGLRHTLNASGSLIGGQGHVAITSDRVFSVIRESIRKEYKLKISYTDLQNKKSKRIIWPLGIAYFDETRIIIAWCEQRNDFRHFRTDRITRLSLIESHYPKRRQALLKQWRDKHNIPEQ
jgi:predicted DNA-binding transcriptional regulator YafY